MNRLPVAPGRAPALVCFALAFAVSALCPPPATGGFLRPLEGSGNFLTTIDVLERAESDGTWSVILLISAANRDLAFHPKAGGMSGELGITVELAGEDGRGARLDTSVGIRCDGREQAVSPTAYQILPLVLRGVTASKGRLTVRIEDHGRERPGFLSRIRHANWARSEAAGDWVAPSPARAPDGLTLHDPVFLARAPIGIWLQQGLAGARAEESVLTTYLHPGRRYGLEQDHLQVYFEVEAAPQEAGAARGGILVQVLAKDLEFALRDTIAFDEAQELQLGSGGATGVFYDLNLKDLPPGVYQLSAAPGVGRGRAWVAEFDVVWSLASLNRFADELLGEGRVVLSGDRLEAFDEARQAEREAILEKFWQELDPDPSTPINEAYQEFRRRVSYVREYYGGFTAVGAVDPRGTVYLLLGPPNEISRQVLPLNETDKEDALVQVFDGYAPDREGTNIKSSAGIPRELTHQSRRAIADKRRETSANKGFELWEYNHDGQQLFPNRYTGQSLGLRFLFVDRLGTGSWALDSTNAVNIGS